VLPSVPMKRAVALALAPLLLVVACGKKEPVEPIEPAPVSAVATGAATTQATAPAAPTGPVRLGEPISAGVVSLKDVVARPADFKGKTIATNGVVTAVCQEMGCWMEIKDDSGTAHVKMAGEKFFVPKTSAGHKARVAGTLVDVGAGGDSECAQEAAHETHTAVAKMQLEATGVELD